MTEGKCPSCGAPVAFTAGSAAVVVCSYCQAVVARKDESFEARGKVARIVDTDSPFKLGLEGRHGGEPFTVVGHLQKDHGAGPWDEWYLEFQSGKKAWLAESEGALNLMFDAGQLELPLASLSPGKRFDFRGTAFVVEEVGRATLVAAEGQLPDDVGGVTALRFVDATGPQGVFLSLEYAEDLRSPEAFVGRAVPFEELGIPADQLRPRAKRAELVQARCPQCNGELPLRAPDQTRRVVCRYCGALLDASQGKLSFLQLLEQPKVKPLIPLGAKGRLGGTEWICIGFVQRHCVVEGIRYPWDEFLLYHRTRGFSWLMLSNNHWTHLLPLAAGDVKVNSLKSAFYKGREYKAFQRVEAITDLVLGEFYWEVQAGERAFATEYVDPPSSINSEETGQEVTFTLGEYLAPEVVKETFNLPWVPSRRGVAPSQPNPQAARQAEQWKWAGLYAVALIALFTLLNVIADKRLVLNETVTVAQGVVPGSAESMFFSAPFEVKRRGNMQVFLFSWPLSNDWLGVQGDLVNEETGEVVSFYSEVSYYSGVDGGESWSEGSSDTTDYISAIPPGRYVLRVTPQYSPSADPSKKFDRHYRLRLTSDVPRTQWFLLALLGLLAAPILNTWRASAFESQRWNDSNLKPGSGSGG